MSDTTPAGTTVLFTADELAERWQVPKGHIYRLTRAGSIPFVKLGRYYRYRVDAIERWELGNDDEEAYDGPTKEVARQR